MIIIIRGQTHSGKTYLAQKLLEKYHFPYLSIDHIKMGLIRSKNCNLTPYSSELELTNYLWPIIKEIIKTNIENNQNLIVEGIYIPCNINNDFEENYKKHIKTVNIIFSEKYIKDNYSIIKEFSSAIESRFVQEDLTKEELIVKHKTNLEECIKNKTEYYLIDRVNDFKDLVNKITL